MRFTATSLVVLLAIPLQNAGAAFQSYNVKSRLAILEDGRLIHQNQRQSTCFRVEIVSDTDGLKPELFKNGHPFVTASKGERYSVRLYNPLPVRVAVNLTVDGLNSITGQPSGIADGQKWMIDPYSSVTIPGWQVTGGEARRFFFTDKPKSYAQWRGDVMGKDLAANCGVIGAAYFWNQKELDEYYDTHPIYRYTRRSLPFVGSVAKSARRLQASPEPLSAQAALDNGLEKKEAQERAGTGMGERESHPTIQVAFDYDRGMYSPSQAVVIYYDFAEIPIPNPFPAIGYAPEMP